MNKKILLSIIPEVLIAIGIIYAYFNRFILSLNGEIATTSTGVDYFAFTEMLSIIISIAFIAIIQLVSGLKINSFVKTTSDFISFVLVVGILTLIIFYFSPKIISDIEMLSIIFFSAFIKLRQSYKNFDGPVVRILGYGGIYIICLFLSLLILMGFGYMGILDKYKTLNILLSVDTLAALIYFSLIGIIFPVIHISKKSK